MRRVRCAVQRNCIPAASLPFTQRRNRTWPEAAPLKVLIKSCSAMDSPSTAPGAPHLAGHLPDALARRIEHHVHLQARDKTVGRPEGAPGETSCWSSEE